MDSIVDTSRGEKEFGWKPEMTVKEYTQQLKQEKVD